MHIIIGIAIDKSVLKHFELKAKNKLKGRVIAREVINVGLNDEGPYK